MPVELVRATALTRRFGCARGGERSVDLAARRRDRRAARAERRRQDDDAAHAGRADPPDTRAQISLQGVPLTPASSDTLRRHIGLLTETPGLWDRLTVRLNLVTYARLYCLPRPQRAVARALALVGLVGPERATSRGRCRRACASGWRSRAR